MTEAGDKHLHLFSIDIKDDEGMVVARVEKVIYIRRKRNAGENGDAHEPQVALGLIVPLGGTARSAKGAQ